MTRTYALTVGIEAHEYDGEFYLVGESHGTPVDVLEYVATDHLLRIASTRTIEDYLLDILKRGANTGGNKYATTEIDVECWIHVDVPFGFCPVGVLRVRFAVDELCPCRLVHVGYTPASSSISNRGCRLSTAGYGSASGGSRFRSNPPVVS